MDAQPSNSRAVVFAQDYFASQVAGFFWRSAKCNCVLQKS